MSDAIPTRIAITPHDNALFGFVAKFDWTEDDPAAPEGQGETIEGALVDLFTETLANSQWCRENRTEYLKISIPFGVSSRICLKHSTVMKYLAVI